MPREAETRVDIGGRSLDCYVEDGQVRARLPFRVRQDRLSELLRRDHYPVASAPGQTDSQGWGRDLDIEDYYPYWVYPDPEHRGRSIFAFPPQDYLRAADGERRPVVGERAQRELLRWFDYLLQARTASSP